MPAKLGPIGAGVTPISFSIPLEEPPEAHVIAEGTPEGGDPAGCSGTVADPQAAPGDLCIFTSEEVNVNSDAPSSPEGGEHGAGKAGSVLFIEPAVAGGVHVEGAWVVTASRTLTRSCARSVADGSCAHVC